MDVQIRYNHPVEVTLHDVCEKWKTAILYKLLGRNLYFGKLKKEIPNVTRKMLTQQLHELKEDSLVQRVSYNKVPPKVEYSLKDYSRKLQPVLEVLANWGRENVKMVKEIKNKENHNINVLIIPLKYNLYMIKRNSLFLASILYCLCDKFKVL